MKKIAADLFFPKVQSLGLTIRIIFCQLIYSLFFLSSATSIAQIPVRMEPRHHKVFENDYVRVLDVHIVPGDTSLFHIHETPSVFIVLTNAKTGTEIINNTVTTKSALNASLLWFDGFYSGPRIHRVWNEDTIEFHVMDVELLHRKYDETGPLMMDKSIKMLFNEKAVIAYNCLVVKESPIKFRKKMHPLLIVDLSGTGEVSVGDKLFTIKGDFKFVPAGSLFTIANKSAIPAKLAIFELK